MSDLTEFEQLLEPLRAAAVARGVPMADLAEVLAGEADVLAKRVAAARQERDRLAAVHAAALGRLAADAAWRAAVVAAVRMGASQTRVAGAAGVSRQRVSQLVAANAGNQA